MGYVHNTHMARRIELKAVVPTVGTWAMAVASHIWTLDKTAAANTSVLQIPLTVPQNSQQYAGAKITSIDVYYKVATANVNTVSAAIYKASLPAAAGTLSAAEITSTITGNLLTQAQQKATITPNTPFYLAEDEDAYLELTINAAATSVVQIQAVVVNYTLRV